MLVSLAGCGGGTTSTVNVASDGQTGTATDDPTSAQVGTTRFYVYQIGDEVYFSSAGGSKMTQPEIEKIGTDVSETNPEIVFEVSDETSQPTTKWAGRVGQYKIRIYFDKHDINSPCLKAKWVPHLNFKIMNVRNGQWICDYHLMLWKKGGVPRFGIWDKASGYCETTDTAYSKIRDKMFNRMVSISIPSWAAWPIAVTAASLVIIILAPKPFPV